MIDIVTRLKDSTLLDPPIVMSVELIEDAVDEIERLEAATQAADPRHPNARLIAAAPELLNAVKKLMSRLEVNELVNHPNDPANKYDQPAYDRAAAAIAKTEGRNP